MKSMKKFFILITVFLVLGFAFFQRAMTNDYYGQFYGSPERITIFPRSLQIIENDAFAGTSLEKIKFEDSVIFIGDRAFQNVFTLQAVYIPENTAYIGPGAFSEATLICGKSGSYAQQWAEENGYSFKSDSAWSNVSATLLFSLIFTLANLFIPGTDKQHEYRFMRVKAHLRNMRPQERCELYPINYRFP